MLQSVTPFESRLTRKMAIFQQRKKAEVKTMYFFETRLGEVFRPRPRAPAQQPPKQGWVVKDGHRRFCGDPSGGSVTCDLNLKVRFRRSFDEFRRGVEDAYGRWMSRPTARMLVKKLQEDLKQ